MNIHGLKLQIQDRRYKIKKLQKEYEKASKNKKIDIKESINQIEKKIKRLRREIREEKYKRGQKKKK